MKTDRQLGQSIVSGFLAGIGAWIAGYVVMYLAIASEVRESPLHQMIEFLQGEPATYETVGWVFYNAHFVPTIFRNVPLAGTRTVTYIGDGNEFSPLLYLIPIVALVATGIVIAWYHQAESPTDGAVAGLSVAPAYFLLSVIGVFVFTVTVGEAQGSPELLPAIALAGVAYPIVLGATGGAIGGYLRARDSEIG